MGKRITSKNQLGGITAGTVNVNQAGEISGHKAEPRKSWHWLYVAAAVAGIIAAIMAVLQLILE